MTAQAIVIRYVLLEILMKSNDIQVSHKDGLSSFNTLSPELVANLLHNLPGMAYRCRYDSQWTMLFLSEGCVQVTGYGMDEILLNNEISYDDIILPDDRLLVKNTIDQATQDHNQYQIEYRILSKSGDIRWVWEQGNAVYDDSGEAQYLDGFISDISALKESRDRLDRMASELAEADLRKDRFLDIIAHDLQNPIYAIISTADFLTQSKNQLNMDQVIDFCSQIHSSAHSVSILLENLVEWSRIQSGKAQIKPQLLKLRQLIESAIKQNDKHVRDKEIAFAIDIPGDLYINSDLRMLEAILRNLISNAVKYSDHGQGITVQGDSDGDGIVLKVIDDGVGMSRERLNTLFDIDNGIHSLGTALETGSGLGLILVKKYVDQLAGKIKIDSKVNKGTKVTVVLPGCKSDHKDVTGLKL